MKKTFRKLTAYSLTFALVVTGMLVLPITGIAAPRLDDIYCSLWVNTEHVEEYNCGALYLNPGAADQWVSPEVTWINANTYEGGAAGMEYWCPWPTTSYIIAYERYVKIVLMAYTENGPDYEHPIATHEVIWNEYQGSPTHNHDDSNNLYCVVVWQDQ